jgi:hypothetical protein
MSITVIPAPDMSGQNAGWQILADSIRQRNAERRAKQAQYQDLILKLSDPNTGEDQQNAMLTQDPKQFEQFYGVPLDQVGKDVATFKNAAKDVIAPGSSMVMNKSEFAGSKRLLVPHPTGTPLEQKQQAELGQTVAQTRQAEATTMSERQRTEYYQQQLGLNAQEARQKDVAFKLGLRQAMRTKDGKTPTPGMIDDYMAGTFDLYPTTEAGKKLESAREILGGDPADPATNLAQMDIVLDHNIKVADLDRVRAETEAARALADERNRRLEFIGKGINPDTGKPFVAGQEVDPKELMALNKGFNEAFSNALGPLGFPSTVTTEGTRAGTIAKGLRRSWVLSPVGGLVDWWTTKTTENPKLAAALFGNGSADPASVRADLAAAIEPGRTIKTIMVPGVDKNGLPGMYPMTLDQAVPAIVQMRRKLGSEMPGVFTALGSASPSTLLQAVTSNPLLEQMAKVYAPALAAKIPEVRAMQKQMLAPAGQAGAANAPVDPNIAPILELPDQYKKEIDDIKRLVQDRAESPSNRPR